MKRLLLLVAVAALAAPATALAKGPDEATITGPGLDKAITITGPEEDGSPMMAFAEAAGFFPAVFAQTPDPMLPDRPKGDLGPRYTIKYHVPGPEGDAYTISQDLYPYALPSAVTYTKSGQDIFEIPEGTRGGWWTDASLTLKDQLVALGLPKTAAAAEDASASSSSAGFFSTGRLGVLVLVLLVLGGATVLMRRRFRGDATA
jgi:hypothetical protein